ncbi:transposase IS116/IS110/IS902 family protein (plasmid) [Rhizobium sp. CCGE 510]|nr:transposase IS116/IS110/IS902 family protein [Rhizobium sp. CCGE 510]
MEAHVSVVGLDIAKSVFKVHAADPTGKAVIRRRLKREEVETFFRKLPLPSRRPNLND